MHIQGDFNMRVISVINSKRQLEPDFSQRPCIVQGTRHFVILKTVFLDVRPPSPPPWNLHVFFCACTVNFFNLVNLPTHRIVFFILVYRARPQLHLQCTLLIFISHLDRVLKGRKSNINCQLLIKISSAYACVCFRP